MFHVGATEVATGTSSAGQPRTAVARRWKFQAMETLPRMHPNPAEPRGGFGLIELLTLIMPQLEDIALRVTAVTGPEPTRLPLPVGWPQLPAQPGRGGTCAGKVGNRKTQLDVAVLPGRIGKVRPVAARWREGVNGQLEPCHLKYDMVIVSVDNVHSDDCLIERGDPGDVVHEDDTGRARHVH